MQPITIDVIELIKVGSIIGGGCVFVGGLIWGYAKLNAKVEVTHAGLEKLDGETAKALDKLEQNMKEERNMMWKKLEDVDKGLSQLHIDVLKAMGERGDKK